MRYLIFGGSGYLGSHLTLQLIEKGHDLINFDNFSGHLANTFEPSVVTIHGDITSVTDMSKLDKYGKIDGVFHVAAKKSVTESLNHPDLYKHVNVTGTKNVLDFCIYNKIKNVVFTSSAAVYGNGITSKIAEDSEKVPINPYGESKLLAEAILEEYCLKYQVSSLALRVFNIVGAKRREFYDDKGENVISIINRNLENANTFTIFGGDFDTKDGTCVRDYVNVSDVARAHILAMAYAEKLPPGIFNTINVCSGIGTSMLELIQMIVRNSSSNLAWTVGNKRSGDPASVIGSNDQAKRLLGWQPLVTLEQSIKESLKL